MSGSLCHCWGLPLASYHESMVPSQPENPRAHFSNCGFTVDCVFGSRNYGVVYLRVAQPHYLDRSPRLQHVGWVVFWAVAVTNFVRTMHRLPALRLAPELIGRQPTSREAPTRRRVAKGRATYLAYGASLGTDVGDGTRRAKAGRNDEPVVESRRTLVTATGRL